MSKKLTKISLTKLKGINTLNSLIIIITSIIFLQLFFLVMYGHHILDYFCLFKLYLINLKFNLINYLKIECMEYICDKIIHSLKKLHIYFKTKVVSGILG
jgi:hypothetical protein